MVAPKRAVGLLCGQQRLTAKSVQCTSLAFESVDSRGGHLGIFWVGICRPGLQIGTPF